MADQVLQHSNSRGSRRGGRHSRNGSKHFADFKGHPGPAGAMDYHAQNGNFGRDFEHHHQAAGDNVQEVHVNGDANTPHSESSESDRIAAYPSFTSIPTTTAGLQSFLVGIRGDIGRLREVEAQVCAFLQDRSEVERLNRELAQEKDRAQAAEDMLKEERRTRMAGEQQLSLAQDRIVKLEQALGDAQQGNTEREEQRSTAEAALAARLATTEAALQDTQGELAALRQADAERQRLADERVSSALATAATWQAKAEEHHKQAWFANNEFQAMDAHYRRQLEALVQDKAAADNELASLRAAVSEQQPPAAGACGAPAGQGVGPAGGAARPGASAAQLKGTGGNPASSTSRSGSAVPVEEVLDDQALMDILLGVVPQGKTNARAFTAADHKQLEAVIGEGAWERLYQVKYGTVLDFLRSHPEAFYRADSGRAFYRPEAPARLPQPSAWPALPSAAGIPARPLLPGGKTAQPAAVPARARAAPLPCQQPIVAIITPAAPPGLAKRVAQAKAAAIAREQAPQPPPQALAGVQDPAGTPACAGPQADKAAQSTEQQQAAPVPAPEDAPAAAAPAPAVAPAGDSAQRSADSSTVQVTEAPGAKKRRRKKNNKKSGNGH